MLDKAIKKSVRADKNRSLEQKTQRAEEATRRGDSRSEYRITNEIVEKRPKTELVKDEFGWLLTDPDKVSEAWATHFKKLLNRPPPDNPPDIPDKPFLNLAVDIIVPSGVLSPKALEDSPILRYSW